MQSHEGLALYSLIKSSNADSLEQFLSKTKIGKLHTTQKPVKLSDN